jgi:hypothetical protein
MVDSNSVVRFRPHPRLIALFVLVFQITFGLTGAILAVVGVVSWRPAEMVVGVLFLAVMAPFILLESSSLRAVFVSSTDLSIPSVLGRRTIALNDIAGVGTIAPSRKMGRLAGIRVDARWHASCSRSSKHSSSVRSGVAQGP